MTEMWTEIEELGGTAIQTYRAVVSLTEATVSTKELTGHSAGGGRGEKSAHWMGNAGEEEERAYH